MMTSVVNEACSTDKISIEANDSNTNNGIQSWGCAAYVEGAVDKAGSLRP